MILRKVISGGQCGVDVAALRTAKALGIETGGTMPLTYRTLSGSKPEYAELFGMVEHESIEYPPRTSANVRDSDATLRIALNFSSTGERCTRAALIRQRKPYVDVGLMVGPDGLRSARLHEGLDAGASSPELAVATWIIDQRIVVLNVAGNSEVTAPGIERFAERFLTTAFSLVRDFGAVSSPP